jgi:hypothetical protein
MHVSTIGAPIDSHYKDKESHLQVRPRPALTAAPSAADHAVGTFKILVGVCSLSVCSLSVCSLSSESSLFSDKSSVLLLPSLV